MCIRDRYTGTNYEQFEVSHFTILNLIQYSGLCLINKVGQTYCLYTCLYAWKRDSIFLSHHCTMFRLRIQTRALSFRKWSVFRRELGRRAEVNFVLSSKIPTQFSLKWVQIWVTNPRREGVSWRPHLWDENQNQLVGLLAITKCHCAAYWMHWLLRAFKI